ncbi:MAG: bifunctional 5,10-methylenetetrahydrofolate dehydrogenase/5,10-methenyltetrahydrofolate cyclohydrolase, partial [Candidatus Paceibacterota bacterium]
MPIILDGKKLSQEIAERLKAEIKSKKLKLTLAIIQVGDHPASNVYIGHKIRYAENIGAKAMHVRVPENVTEKKLISVIKKLNKDKKVSGIIIQMPFPEHLDKKTIIDTVDPKKDVDGLHSVNAAKVFQDDPTGILPATPKGVISLLKEYGTEMEGKRALVVGKSLLVGRPAAMLLLRENATVTMAHSRTKDLPKLAREHDIIVVAVGRAGLITRECVKAGQVIVDVGTNAVGGPKELEEG